MADSSPGLWASLAAAIPGLGALGWAVFRVVDDKKQNAHEIAVSHDRDSAQQDLNESVQQYIDRLVAENATLRSERDAERKSGLEHYGRCVRMYGELGRIVAGGPPPDTLKRMEEM